MLGLVLVLAPIIDAIILRRDSKNINFIVLDVIKTPRFSLLPIREPSLKRYAT